LEDTKSNLVLFDSLAIAKHLVRTSEKKEFLGSSHLEEALIEMWLNTAFTQLKPAVDVVTGAIFGQSVFEDEYNAAVIQVKLMLFKINSNLSGRKFMVGDQLTIADVALAGLLAHPL